MRSQSNKKLFQEIVSAQDKVRILTYMTQEKLPIRARVRKGQEFDTRAINWTPPMRMEVQAPKELKLGLQTLTLQFDCREERYFSNVDLAFDDWKLYFVFNQPLYRLQRRQYQRLKLPQKYKSRVLIMNLNEAVWNEECEILDISLGGCSLKTSYRILDAPAGSVVLMDMQVGDHPSFMQIGRVCYMRPQKFEGRNKVRVGVQFRPHPKYSLHLQSVIQNLAVDIFTHWTSRK